MRAALISLGSTSSMMVSTAMKKYFTVVDDIQLKDIEVALGKECGIFYKGKELEQYDCVYLKGSFRYANLLRSISAMLEGQVLYMPLHSNAFTIIHNKLLTHLMLQQHTIPMPRTYVTSTTEAAKELLKRISYPIVMKFPEGTQGKGVMFAESFSSASSLLDALGALNQPFIIQEYVETNGTDIRALVVGDKVVAAMRRRAQREEKRANIHAGGTGEAVQLSRDVINLAIDTAKALGVDICGVDILESSLGPKVIEANISPGLQGLSTVANVDLGDEIARFLFTKTEELLHHRKKIETTKTLHEMQIFNEDLGQEIITPLTFRGERILLPEFITRLTSFNERKEYVVRAQKGKVEIREFKI